MTPTFSDAARLGARCASTVAQVTVALTATVYLSNRAASVHRARRGARPTTSSSPRGTPARSPLGPRPLAGSRRGIGRMDKRYQVFVSSTYADLHDERDSVIRMLLQMGAIPTGMELFPAADEEQLR